MPFSQDIFDLAAAVLDRARARGIRLACAESCTGGLVAAALTEVPGSSDVFAGGIVSYALDVKERLLGVDGAILYDQGIGAVSPQCAEAMATGVSEALRADLAVSVTGIAGPGGEEPGKPVGTVWFGCFSNGAVSSERMLFEGNRGEVREQALVHALTIMYGNLA